MSLTEQTWLAFYVAAVLALFIDQWIGEPAPKWHPVVWMGNYLSHAGVWVQQHTVQAQDEKPDWRSFWCGVLAWMLGASLVLLLAGIWQWFLWRLHWGLAVIFIGISLKPLLSRRMLLDEVQAVEQQLDVSLHSGQQQLARLVSRDVNVLDITQVRESALETLAENLNDSIIAPLFWFALLGLPGAALYRFADTADSMWGYMGQYKKQHWEWAGKWAAKFDDVLAWVPARLTAFLLLATGYIMQRVIKAPKGIWSRALQLSSQASLTPSPNSGWCMAALALVFNVCLRKSGVYVLNAQGVQVRSEHIAQALRLSSYAVLAGMMLWAVGVVLLYALSVYGSLS